MAAREGRIGGAWDWRWWREVGVKEDVEDEEKRENQKEGFEAGRIDGKRFEECDGRHDLETKMANGAFRFGETKLE